MQAKEFQGDGAIAPAGEHHWMDDFADAKFVGQRLRERFLAGSAGEEQGAIDVEEANVHGAKSGESRVESRSRLNAQTSILKSAALAKRRDVC